MYTKTTLYIRNDLLLRLDNAVDRLNCSRSRLVSDLLVTYMAKNNAGGVCFKRLKYQPRNDKAVYTAKSLFLRNDVYELWCDVRKAFKLSASFIISIAIEHYLDMMINNKKLLHNYFPMYITNTSYHGKTCIIQIIWGELEKEKLKKLIFT